MKFNKRVRQTHWQYASNHVCICLFLKETRVRFNLGETFPNGSPLDCFGFFCRRDQCQWQSHLSIKVGVSFDTGSFASTWGSPSLETPLSLVEARQWKWEDRLVGFYALPAPFSVPKRKLQSTKHHEISYTAVIVFNAHVLQFDLVIVKNSWQRSRLPVCEEYIGKLLQTTTSPRAPC